MSRSYKKYPVVKDCRRSSKQNKKIANRCVRRKLKGEYYIYYPKGAYRKIYNSWDIHDWIFHETLKEFLHHWQNSPWLQREFKTRKAAENYWYKIYKRK